MNHSLHELSFVSIPASQVEWECLYKDSGSGAKLDGSCWRPIPPIDRLVSVGDTFVVGHESPATSTQPINQYVDKRLYQPVNQMSVLFAVKSDYVVKQSINQSVVWSDRGSGAKQDIELFEAQPEEGFVSLGLYANINNQSSDQSTDQSINQSNKPVAYLVNQSLVSFDGEFSSADASWTDTGSNSDHHIQTFYNSSYHTFVCTNQSATKIPLIGFRIGAFSKSAEIKLPTTSKYLPNSVAPYEDVKHLLVPTSINQSINQSVKDGPAVEPVESVNNQPEQQGDDGQFHQEDFQMV